MKSQRKPVSQWSEAERLEWGTREDAIRKQELATVKSSETLRAVQDAAKRRRTAVGASAGQALDMVIMARRVGIGR